MWPALSRFVIGEEGNRRFVDGRPLANRTNTAMRKELVEQGQAPHTAIIGCADSRAPLETIFDAMPGRCDTRAQRPALFPTCRSVDVRRQAVCLDVLGAR